MTFQDVVTFGSQGKELNSTAAAGAFSMCGSADHTASAIRARDQDEKRVRLYLDQTYEKFPIFWNATQKVMDTTRCKAVSDALLRNFFRDVGTDLYNRMVTRN